MSSGALRLEWVTEARRAAGARASEGFVAIARTNDIDRMTGSVVTAGGKLLAAIDGDELVGYLTLCPFVRVADPRLARRWDGLEGALELGGLEVARPARRRGIARRLVDALVGEADVERAVVAGFAVVHHWDLEGAALGPAGYRRVLERLLARAGFHALETDDPEILEHPASFLAAREGALASPRARSAFHARLLGASAAP